MRQNGTLSEEEFQSLKTLILQRLSVKPSEKNQSKQTETEKLQPTGEDEIQSQKQGHEVDQFLIYENPTHSFKMNYPKDWEGTETNRSSQNGFIIVVEFGLPFEKNRRYYGRYKQLLNVQVRYLYSNALSLDTYVRQRIFLFKTKMKDLEIIESSQMKLSNHDAHKLRFRYRHSDPSAPARYESIMVWIMGVGVLYVISSSAREDEFHAGLSSFEYMINSFQIIKNTVTESNDHTVNSDGFVVYDNRTLGFMIEHPAEWIVNEEKFGPVSQIQFLSPSETNPELFDNRIIVETKALSLLNTLDDYVHAYTNQLMKKTPKSLNFTLLESVQIKTISGTSVKKVIYKTSSPTRPEFRTIEVFAINDKYVYSVTFGEEISKFVQYYSFVEEMIQSIKFHTQESNENASPTTDDTNDKSLLSVSLNLSEESLNRGEQQNISVRILDGKSNDEVPYATIRMDLFYPLGRFENLIDKDTDERGQLLYTWTVNDGCEIGEYTLTVRATAAKYQAKTESAKFRVKSTSTDID